MIFNIHTLQCIEMKFFVEKKVVPWFKIFPPDIIKHMWFQVAITGRSIKSLTSKKSFCSACIMLSNRKTNCWSISTVHLLISSWVWNFFILSLNTYWIKLDNTVKEHFFSYSQRNFISRRLHKHNSRTNGNTRMHTSYCAEILQRNNIQCASSVACICLDCEYKKRGIIDTWKNYVLV